MKDILNSIIQGFLNNVCKELGKYNKDIGYLDFRLENINNGDLKTLFGQFRDYVIEYQLTNRKYYLDKCDYSMLADNYVNMIKGNSLKRERY